MKSKAPRIMISAISSNSGKTTITAAILKAFQLRGNKVASFKAGPDYIDPMFHSKIIKIPSRNLDKFMIGENNCRYIMGKGSSNIDVSVIEGVMGYYDGIGTNTSCSSYELSAALNCPVVLVINPSSMAASVGAIIHGFKSFRENSNIRGVILNNVSDAMYGYYKKIIESNTDIKVYGYMPNLPNCRLESRHLGLVTAEEVGNLESIIEQLGTQALKTIDLDCLYELAAGSAPIEYTDPNISYIDKTKIAIANDKAFCFYYEDNLDILTQLGAEIVKFSPLKDKELPEGIGGLYIGGGYPELYIKELSENISMLDDIKEKVSKGLPTFAECGGYMYLMDSFTDKEGNLYNMVGAVEGNSYMTDSLRRFGYITLTSQNNNLMCNTGESINGHEFHYSDSNNTGEAFLAVKPESVRSWKAVIADETKFLGYPHINFMGNINFAENFVKRSVEYSKLTVRGVNKI
ncbi:cobyrinate a,c-diamide synthase [Sedimentibacter sp. MB31-C6]|uniref:cobyrinate a,c-diamide synthase n=1 Tax=Sedimentibacter sp. MB31-C6 TaxID=3109366 RepID=UPI002DDCDC46|nr:cobyrinate a,c-diamide synthase [Sedimentibacter sp. MB36-C1]WSI05568.1 cobyrinate a,c-diamide synthase [Sedimentibacter sp. MB36-C1]